MKTNSFVKQLASNKRTVRENALKTLKKFLSSREKSKPLTLLELKKLWKGLYFTMWFSDRPLPQQRLANDLASLFSDCVVEEQFLNFVEAFWVIIGSEWRELDKWRIDKYYMLMRYVIRECFVKLGKENWDAKLVNDYLEVLKRTVLSEGSRFPVSITYHVIDIWVDELERSLFGELEKKEVEETDEIIGESDIEVEEESEEERVERITRRKEILKEGNVPIDALLAVFKEKFHKRTNAALKEKMRLEVFEDDRLIEMEIDLSLPEEENKNSEEDEDDDDEEEEEEEVAEEEAEEWTGFGTSS